jgi:CBS domain-containing protein
MGEQDVKQFSDEATQQKFMKSLLLDLQAMEYMLENNMFETGIRRIGAEQEMFIVDKARKPGLLALKMLDQIDDERFTHELGLFNVEANLSPYELGGKCLSEMEAEGQYLYKLACEAAAKVGGDIALVGILPTLSKKYLGLDCMVPTPRYHALNNALVKLRGKEFQFSIEGIDQLNVIHDNVMLEACNTSFQVHFQVEPDEFARLYNIAQVVTGPLLAASVNSPLLLGKRLWHETRIAVFEHSVDARSKALAERGLRPRVHFGDGWINDSVIEIFKEDIARFRVILTSETEDDPLAMLKAGRIPKLRALTLHNGTVYRWNRACYGVADNVAHLRIENRVIPSGPTVLDEMANATFFIGMMAGMAARKEDVRDKMLFEYARTNFISAARDGLKAQQLWYDERQIPAQDLIVNELLPLAFEGLEQSGVDKDDAERYLDVIEQRVRTRRTGARWALESLAAMGDEGTLDERLRSLTTSMIRQQKYGSPVHEWELAESCPTQDWRDSYRTVGQFMATDLFTVRADDIIDFAASIMDWRHIRHVPVEDDEGNLVGLVSHRSLLRLVARGLPDSPQKMTVSDIMNADPEVLKPETTTVEAIRTMREKKVACLPVTENGRLVGIVTDYDLIVVSSRLLEEYLSEDA